MTKLEQIQCDLRALDAIEELLIEARETLHKQRIGLLCQHVVDELKQKGKENERQA